MLIMKIAVTADVHLNPNHPERAHALADILKQAHSEEISELVIAGDLFDKDGDSDAYDDFRKPCREYPSIRVHVVPGNHDLGRSLTDVAPDLPNLRVYDEPSVENFGGILALFLPYREGISMNEALLECRNVTADKPWVLVAHGDFISGVREPNPRESRIYMPLKQGDLNHPHLRQVFLGHIHKPTPLDRPLAGKVLHPGSPQGLDVTECGPRRFLVYDTDSGVISDRKVNSSKIFLNETLLSIPSCREFDTLAKAFKTRLEESNLSDNELREKTQMRIRVEGYALKKDELVESFRNLVRESGVGLYEEEGPNFDSVSTVSDPQRKVLARDSLRNLNELAQGTLKLPHDENNEQGRWDFGKDEPSIEEVRMAVLEAIYKR